MPKYEDGDHWTVMCRWCKGTGRQTAPHLAPMSWACPDCFNGRLRECPDCGEAVGPTHECESSVDLDG